MNERRWTLGETFVLRHPGFPFDWLESLGFADDALGTLDALGDAEGALLTLLGKAAVEGRRALSKGKAPQRPSGVDAGAWDAAVATWRGARESAMDAYREGRKPLAARLHELGRDDRVQEAVFLSSPDMFDNVWRRYVALQTVPTNANGRRMERQVYTYLQRLCGKNETTSFFGPMGYGEVVDEPITLRVVPSGDSRRRVFLAHWAVKELARAATRDGRVRAHVPFERNRLVDLSEGRARCEALGIDVPLDESQGALLETLSEGGTLAEAARRLGRPARELERAALPLLKANVLLRGFIIPPQEPDGLTALRRGIDALPEGEVRTHWTATLRELEELRRRFEEGDLETRRAVLPEWEARFTALTGAPSRRSEGSMYADRYIYFEEAASPFRLEVGRAYAEELARRLSGGLELSAAFGESVQAGRRAEVRERLGETEGRLDFLSYATRARPEGVAGSRFAPVREWRVPPTPEEELDVPQDALGVSGDGPRFALPDVCLEGAPDERGELPPDTRVLLARVHHHLLVPSWLALFHPSSERFARVSSEAIGSGRLGSLVGLAIGRRNKGYYRFPGRRLVFNPQAPGDVSEEDLLASRASVRVTAESMELLDEGGRPLRLYLPLDDFNNYAPFAALASPQVLHARVRTGDSHVPRIRIGGAIYQRRQWEVDAAPIREADALGALVVLRSWAREHGWPRYLFVRVSGERKPYLVDTCSPYGAELLAHAARAGERLTFQEMLPNPEGLWLRDARGRYTCELRMQVLREDDRETS